MRRRGRMGRAALWTGRRRRRGRGDGVGGGCAGSGGVAADADGADDASLSGVSSPSQQSFVTYLCTISSLSSITRARHTAKRNATRPPSHNKGKTRAGTKRPQVAGQGNRMATRSGRARRRMTRAQRLVASVLLCCTAAAALGGALVPGGAFAAFGGLGLLACERPRKEGVARRARAPCADVVGPKRGRLLVRTYRTRPRSERLDP